MVDSYSVLSPKLFNNSQTDYYINLAGYILQYWFRGNDNQISCPINSFYVEVQWDNQEISNGKQILNYIAKNFTLSTSSTTFSPILTTTTHSSSNSNLLFLINYILLILNIFLNF